MSTNQRPSAIDSLINIHHCSAWRIMGDDAEQGSDRESTYIILFLNIDEVSLLIGLSP